MKTFLSCIIFATGATLATFTHAHGTLNYPPSRAYVCEQNPELAACQAVEDENGPPALFQPWAIIYPDLVNDDATVLPANTLCSGNLDNYSGYNQPRSDWQASEITRPENGEVQFRYNMFIAHGVRDFVYYITDEGFDVANDNVSWQNISEFCRVDGSEIPSGFSYANMNCTLPERSGHHVIFSIWHSSSPDYSFYACSDVNITSQASVTATLTPTAMPTLIPTSEPTSNIWHLEKPWINLVDIQQGDTLRFEVFDSNDTLLEQYQLTVTDDTLSSDLANEHWQQQLIVMINAASNLVQIGTFNDNNEVAATNDTPNIYLKNAQHHTLLSQTTAPAIEVSTGNFSLTSLAALFALLFARRFATNNLKRRRATH